MRRELWRWSGKGGDGEKYRDGRKKYRELCERKKGNKMRDRRKKQQR